MGLRTRRILQVKGSYDPAGGPEALLCTILGAEDRGGWESVLVMLEKGGRAASATILDAGPRRTIRWRGIACAPFSARDLGRIAREEGAALIHTHDMRAALAAWLLTRRRRIPWIAHVHGWLGPTHSRRFRLYEGVDRLLIRGADLVLVGSHAARREVERAGGRRVRVVPNAVDIPRDGAFSEEGEKVRSALGIPRGEIVAGMIGRVHPGKGQDVFLAALDLLRRSKLRLRGLIVGEGPYLQRLRQRVRELALEDAVVCTGFVPQRWPYIAAMDILAVPSLKESLPLSALEGMALGRPLVASRTGDLDKAVEEGRSGFLVPPGDAVALAGALAQLASSHLLRREFGERGRRIAVERYAAEVMVKGIGEAYEELLGGDGRMEAPT